MHYRVGTRGSKLALVQTDIIVQGMQKAWPEDTFEVVVIHTMGDKIQDRPLDQIGSKGVFVEEIEQALLEDRIQLAVHSMKDMPEQPAEGLTFAGAWKRGDARDVLLSRTGKRLRELPAGAVIATGSKRRQAELAQLYPTLRVVGIRGNVDTRIRKLQEGLSDGQPIDGLLLAAAGVERLGRGDEITEYLDPREMIPSPAQGTLAVEVRADHTELLAKLNALSDAPTRRAVQAERGFLQAIGGDCHQPIGAYYTEDAQGNAELLTLYGASSDGPLVRTAIRRAAGETDIDMMIQEAVRETRIQLGR